jgi:hypothetical protein
MLVLQVSHALANFFSVQLANRSLTMATTGLITKTLQESHAFLLLQQSHWPNPPRVLLSFRWRGRATHNPKLTGRDQASFWGSQFAGCVCCADLCGNNFEHQEIPGISWCSKLFLHEIHAGMFSSFSSAFILIRIHHSINHGWTRPGESKRGLPHLGCV